MATPPPAAPPPPPNPQALTALLALYAWAEGSLIARLTSALRATPATAAGAMIVQAAARRAVAQVGGYLTQHTPQLVAALIAAETGSGRAHADQQLAAIPRPRGGAGSSGSGTVPPPGGTAPGPSLFPPEDPFDLSLDHGERAARAIEADLQSALEDVRRRITRLPDDIYKAIAPQAVIYQVVDNNFTPQQAQSMAWRVFTSQGITGFTDRSGRDWSLNAYVEMAVRTASARAFRESSLQRMLAVGIHYFRVAEHVHPCPQCHPWQHRVLAAEADVSGFPTLADAIAAGLMHPNCRCTLIPWIPEVDAVPAEREWTEADQARYVATQRQRALEREIRKAKQAAQTALDTDTRVQANADVKRLQKRMRDFLAAHDYLGRDYRREQPRLRMDRTKTEAWRPTGPNPDPNVIAI